MKKDTFYFPHDTNARNDPRLVEIFMELDLSGIGFYWNIIEILHSEPTSKLTEKQFQDYIKFYWRTINEQMFNKIQQTFLDVKLFVLEDGFIYSNRVIKNKETREYISNERSKAGKKSAEIKKLKTNVQQTVNKPSTNRQQNSTIKGNKSKEDIKENINNNINNNKNPKKEISDSNESAAKIDFISQVLNIFCKEFKNSRGIDFELVNKGRERQAIGKLVANYKNQHKENPKTTEQTIEFFRGFFEKCLAIPDKWHFEKMSPCHIGSEINSLLTILKGKNNGARPSGADVVAYYYGEN